MTRPGDCSQNTDPLKLVREGTGQDDRSPESLDPAYVPVNEHGLANSMVFAQGYSAFLKYFDQSDNPAGNWSPFFSNDVSVLLAVPAIEDVNDYKTSLQEWFAYLNESENQNKEADLKQRFGFLYASVASLAQQLDGLKGSLPDKVALKGKLQNLIRTQLAPAFRRLIAYYGAGTAPALDLISDVAPPMQILRRSAVRFASVLTTGLSEDWSDGVVWAAYLAGIAVDASVYGTGGSVFTKINHCSTHTLFKSAFDQFLKVFAGVVTDANAALADTLNNDDTHEPHYALYLAFLRLLEYARAYGNTLTKSHLDFYYRTILGLKEKSAQPGHVHLLAELAKQAVNRDFTVGEAFRAGKDSQGKDAFFANQNDFVANRAKIDTLKTLYRHGDEPVDSGQGQQIHRGRIFASPVANSDDGLGKPLTSTDGSWHPFFNKIYADGTLTEIRMPKAEIGFAIASHYFLMAGGRRVITAGIEIAKRSAALAKDSEKKGSRHDLAGDIRCLVTTEKGWVEITSDSFSRTAANRFELRVDIDGSYPPIVPYSAKTHGYNFQTDLPMLLVELKQDDTRTYAYSQFQDITITSIELNVDVSGLRPVAASNDFGPLDTSKPFAPFGGSPTGGSSFIIGSKEIFQKDLSWLEIDLGGWMTAPAAYPTDASLPNVEFDVLDAGDWTQSGDAAVPVGNSVYELDYGLENTVEDKPDFTANAFYNTQSRNGYVRLRLTGGFGQDAYQTALIAYLHKDSTTNPGSKPPSGPIASSLSVSYEAVAILDLDSSHEGDYENRPAQFFHLAPFGTAEQHPYLQGGAHPFLFPQFRFERDAGTLASEAEFYIGVTGLAPPQNLSLLFQVADGTANPLTPKPHPHIDWSYLRQNQWVDFAANDVQDATDELLNSGIVVLSMPRDANNSNTLLASGLHWIRAAVRERSDAVCRLQLVAAQAMEAVFTDRANSPTFSDTPLPAMTISKLEVPDAAVKGILQPFPSFGGCGAEQSRAFYTRISERLRHKNRAIDLWDYERLVLEAFPQIYKVKCLNHTCYEPNPEGTGIYRELAPGHITIVTIPNLQAQNQRDPLKPNTSLGLLDEIKTFLEERTSCFAKLHVKNPQFEPVRVRFSVRLYDGFDESYYKTLLAQAITRFLSPWAFGGSAPTFGGKVYKSVLIGFVEDQPYVDYVTDFKLFHDTDEGKGTVDLDEVEGSCAVSVLVSTPASQHEITTINAEQADVLGESCSCDA